MSDDGGDRNVTDVGDYTTNPATTSTTPEPGDADGGFSNPRE